MELKIPKCVWMCTYSIRTFRIVIVCSFQHISFNLSIDWESSRAILKSISKAENYKTIVTWKLTVDKMRIQSRKIGWSKNAHTHKTHCEKNNEIFSSKQNLQKKNPIISRLFVCFQWIISMTATAEKKYHIKIYWRIRMPTKMTNTTHTHK